MALQIENYQTNNPNLIDENQAAYDGFLNQKSAKIKSSWVETTTSGKSCFLTGRGTNYGTQSHITVHSAMDQVILKHHKAAQKQYVKMRTAKGPSMANSIIQPKSLNSTCKQPLSSYVN